EPRAAGVRTRELVVPAFDAGGRSGIFGIPPGPAQLRVPVRMRPGNELVGRVDVDLDGLVAGTARELELDVSRWLPVELPIRARVNGKPAAGAIVVLHVTADDGEPAGSIRAELDGDGRAVLG